MNQFILRIDDVGRTPKDANPEVGTDRELEYFFEWYYSTGLDQVPAVFGLTPTWVEQDSIVEFNENVPVNRRALHGWHHSRSEETTISQMEEGLALLGATTYIPPFNAYSLNTFFKWKKAGGKRILGGIYNDHQMFGEEPRTVMKISHWSACPELYGRSCQILKALDTFVEKPFNPVVVTLHVPWELSFTQTRELIDRLRPDLVELGKVS